MLANFGKLDYTKRVCIKTPFDFIQGDFCIMADSPVYIF